MQTRAVIDEFLTFCAVERQLSPHSLQAYAADLQDFRRWLRPNTSWSDVSKDVLKAYLRNLTERKLAAATIRRRFACLRAFFRRLSSQIESPDPFQNWTLRMARRKRLPRTLARAEITSLLSTLKRVNEIRLERNDTYSTAVRLMVSTGLRVGELCRIQIDDVAPDGSGFRIHGKGSRDRTAYVTDSSLADELKTLVERRRVSAVETGPLFLNRHGRPLRPQSIRSKLRRHAQRCGLSRRITPHMLRHTAATLLIETGVDIRFVQRLLGHSSIATTEIYTHVSDEALKLTLAKAYVLQILR